jgi:exopolyphosphatase/guanosine-5'-triphosphate,3'-diphosphate pyrophosphatase
MRIAAIDIGTNAVRLIVKEVVEFGGEFRSHKICYTRVPIRLGADVFTEGKISDEKRNQLTKTIEAFHLLMDVQGVERYRACSTSAMRESSNGEEVVSFISEQTGVGIEVISGEEEAKTIMANFRTQRLDPSQKYLYIDVGGGSTEVSLIHNGERLEAKSFRIGTVRLLLDKVNHEEWERLEEFAKELKSRYRNIIGIGTGGNINRIYKEAGKTKLSLITGKEIERVREYLSGYSYQERVHLLRLKPDRADVILPASEIYLKTMAWSGVEKMIVPKLGLSDGLILQLFEDIVQEQSQLSN